MKQHILCIGSLALAATTSIAQPTMDLTMVDNGLGQYEVRLRPDADFGDVISALTFAIRWDSAVGAALDTAVILQPAEDYLPVSGGQQVYHGNGYRYSVYNGFGFAPIVASGPAWLAGREYPLCTIDILVPGTTFELVNDAWTAANNTDYFVSLNGTNSTGVYYPSVEPEVDIRTMANGNGGVDVAVAPAESFFGTVTDINFTLRWPVGSGATLGAVSQAPYEASYLPIQKVGSEMAANGYIHQVFHGAGSISLANTAVGLGWMAGIEHVIMSVPLIGSATVEVIDDAWTNQNNGDYSIELNGTPHTGETYGNTTAVNDIAEENTPAITTSLSGSMLHVEVPNPDAEPVHIQAFNSVGSVIAEEHSQHTADVSRFDLELAGATTGVVVLRAKVGERTITTRIVLQ